MAGNIGEYENPQNPIDSGEVNNQTNPIDPKNDDTQHGWTDPNGGNMDPHYQGDTEPVDGGEVTVVTHFGEEVVGKIDRLINILKPQGTIKWWRDDTGNFHFKNDQGGYLALTDAGSDGKMGIIENADGTLTLIYYWGHSGSTTTVIISEDENGNINYNIQ